MKKCNDTTYRIYIDLRTGFEELLDCTDDTSELLEIALAWHKVEVLMPDEVERSNKEYEHNATQ